MAGDSYEAALESILIEAFEPPSLPRDLRARVIAAIARQPTIDRQRLRARLEQEHRLAVAALNRSYLRGCRDAALAGSCGVAMIGSTVKPLAHWLSPWLASAAPGAAGVVALGTGLLLSLMLARE